MLTFYLDVNTLVKVLAGNTQITSRETNNCIMNDYMYKCKWNQYLVHAPRALMHARTPSGHASDYATDYFPWYALPFLM